MADRVVLLMLDDVLVGQAGEIIVALVVFAHMVEAEAMILAFLPAALGRRVESGLARSPAARKPGRSRAAGGPRQA